MDSLPQIQALRERAGCARYVLDPPEDRCAFLREAGFGILRSVPAFHREHPHSAYLFGPSEGEEGERRTQTLVLPTGSLKRTQILRQGRWENETEYCLRPHHWAKLGLHLTDLTAVMEHYPAQSAQAGLEAWDLLAIRLPLAPLEMLLAEFVGPAFLAREWEADHAAVRKAIRQIEPYMKEALAACSAVPSDLYLLDVRRLPPCPDACRDELREEYRKLVARLSARPILSLAAEDGPEPGIRLLPGKTEATDGILLPEDWDKDAAAWQSRLAASAETTVFIPWIEEKWPELSALSPGEAENACAPAQEGVQ